MKITKFAALALALLTITACSSDKEMAGDMSEEALNQQLAQAAQIGQAQAIAEIIERTITQPCQPINLFNNIDEGNKKEVNLINIACENLDLPEMPAAPAADDMMDEMEDIDETAE